MWNGNLNRQRAKAMNQMIVGMIDVLINNNQQASIDGDIGVVSMEFGQCSRWESNLSLKEWSCRNLANSGAVRLSL